MRGHTKRTLARFWFVQLRGWGQAGEDDESVFRHATFEVFVGQQEGIFTGTKSR